MKPVLGSQCVHFKGKRCMSGTESESWRSETGHTKSSLALLFAFQSSAANGQGTTSTMFDNCTLLNTQAMKVSNLKPKPTFNHPTSHV